MKKALMILILTAILTGCGNSAKEDEKTVTTAVSHETTTAVTTASVSGTTDLTTTEISAETTDATAGKISTSRTTKKTETTTSKATTKAKVTTTKKSTSTTTGQTQTASVQTYIVYYDEPAPETQQTEVKVTETTTTTVQTSPPNTTTTPKQTAASSGIEWSDSMKVWRKLCEGKKLSGSEQDMIRSEILDYAVSTFNGKKDIHVSFGIDSYDISYEKPLNLTINRSMTSMANAHYDAYTDPDSKWLIDYASSEQEIYDIVSDTRQSCLHVIDHGLFNRWEIFSMNGSLKYASDIEFNVGFDDEMTIWFLTQD